MLIKLESETWDDFFDRNELSDIKGFLNLLNCKFICESISEGDDSFVAFFYPDAQIGILATFMGSGSVFTHPGDECCGECEPHWEDGTISSFKCLYCENSSEDNIKEMANLILNGSDKFNTFVELLAEINKPLWKNQFHVEEKIAFEFINKVNQFFGT